MLIKCVKFKTDRYKLRIITQLRYYSKVTSMCEKGNDLIVQYVIYEPYVLIYNILKSAMYSIKISVFIYK